MPATTPQGLPYPLPTEPVAEGAAAIRALAEALDARPRTAVGASAVFVYSANDQNHRIYVPAITKAWSDFDAIANVFPSGGYVLVPVTGRYLVHVEVANPTPGVLSVGAIINDSAQLGNLQLATQQGDAGNVRGRYSRDTIASLSAGQTLKYYGYNTTGNSGTCSLGWALTQLGRPLGTAGGALLDAEARDAAELEAELEAKRFFDALPKVENPEFG